MTTVKISDIKIGNSRRSVDPERVKMLAESIEEIGLQNIPVISSDNVLISGMHRLEAYKLLGKEEIEVRVIELNNLLTELAEIDENLIRNNGLELEQARWLARRKEIYEQLHPETRQGKTPGNQYTGQNRENDIMSFSEDTAKKTGRTRRTIERKQKIGKKISKEVQDILLSENASEKLVDIADNQAELLTLSRFSDDEQYDIIDRVVSGEAESVRDAVHGVIREERIKKILKIAFGNSPLDSVPEKYVVVYADPPWKYEHVKTENRAIENQYPTMELQEICDLPVEDITTPDSILFLWATNPKLTEALQVIDAWGYTYRTNMVWVKDKIGMGYYFRGQHELLLVATRGNLPVPEESSRKSSVLNSDRTEHSEKPEEVYSIIEEMYSEYPRIELFSRNAREGWWSWGNQV